MKTKELHFKVDGQGITDLARDIYLYEDKQKALNILKSMIGITDEQVMMILVGDAKLLNDKDDDTLLEFVQEEDIEFKIERQNHLDFLKSKEIIVINKIEVKRVLVENYINHFNRKKTDLWKWENKRKELHDAIFESVNIDRLSIEGKEFSDALDKYCIPLIEKFDYFVASLKKISSAKNAAEIFQAELDFKNKRYYEQMKKRKRDDDENQ